jgi:hypothetical protein
VPGGYQLSMSSGAGRVDLLANLARFSDLSSQTAFKVEIAYEASRYCALRECAASGPPSL